jgi:phosphatidylethanolamine-binding protein (PEBP) family uncharacterized protein
MRCARLVLSLAFVALARAPLKLRANFGGGSEFPVDSRGDEDNISPPISWTGAPKRTESFVLIVDSTAAGAAEGDGASRASKVHWLLYDIPKDVRELREELSGAGSSDVGRLGFKEDAGQAPVVVDPMGQIDGWVDPEIEAMQNMIHSALDQSFEDKNRAKEGATSFGSTYYRGPSEPGTTCTLKLYALSGRLELPRGASREQVVKAMKGKVLGKATLNARIE